MGHLKFARLVSLFAYRAPENGLTREAFFQRYGSLGKANYIYQAPGIKGVLDIPLDVISFQLVTLIKVDECHMNGGLRATILLNNSGLFSTITGDRNYEI